MQILSFLVILFLLLGLAQGGAEPPAFRGGKIYELNSNKKKLLFTINAKLATSSNGHSVFLSSYLDANNEESLTEEASFKQLELQRYVIDQKQLNEIYELKITDGKMFFSITKKGRVEKKTQDLSSGLIIGPSFVPFLQQHWAELQGRKKVRAQLAVLERMNTYSFEFEKLRDAKSNSVDVVIIRMKPTSTLLSAVVRPVYFTVTSDGSKILELKGRMLPKRKAGSRWEDVDGEAVFTY